MIKVNVKFIESKKSGIILGTEMYDSRVNGDYGAFLKEGFKKYGAKSYHHEILEQPCHNDKDNAGMLARAWDESEVWELFDPSQRLESFLVIFCNLSHWDRESYFVRNIGSLFNRESVTDPDYFAFLASEADKLAREQVKSDRFYERYGRR